MSDNKFMLEADQFNRGDWNYIRENIKWLKGIASTDYTRPVLQGIYFNKDKGWIAATDGYKIGVWKPEQGKEVTDMDGANSPLLDVLPAGIWWVDTLNSKMIMMREVEGNFPDIAPIINVPETTNALAGIDGKVVVVDIKFNPTLLSQLTAGFGVVTITIKNSIHYVYPDAPNGNMIAGENFGVLMGHVLKEGEGYKSSEIRLASADKVELV